MNTTAATVVIFAIMACLPGAALAASSTSAEQTKFRQLFKIWEKSDKRPVPASLARHRGASISADKFTISSAAGMRVNPVTGRRMLHSGADLAVPLGTMVHATADGVIMQAGSVGSYGLLVSIGHRGGYETRYAHMSRILVTTGERVRKGDLIGHVGSTGRSTGPHLHYEIRRLGRIIDPVPSLSR